MIFEAPALDDREISVIGDITSMRAALRNQLNEPRRWVGSLRRMSFARNIRGSNSIEGYDAQLDDAAAVAAGEEPIDTDAEARLALSGYRDAMTYVLQLAQDGAIPVDLTLIKSLHFMMTSYSLTNRPGRWRSGSIYVREEETGDLVYTGPDSSRVPELMEQLVESLTASSQENEPEVVRAAMAHLNLVMIHPFRDGNGRMARCLQSLMLAGSGETAPIFMSIEEYLGRHTPEYYRVLAETGGGSWNPERDTRPWIRFSLTAHYEQARLYQRRIKVAERLWSELERVVSVSALPERTITALFDAAVGYRVRAGTYGKALAEQGENVGDRTVGRDLTQLAELGLLVARGERRGRFYTASEALKGLNSQADASAGSRVAVDPFADTARTR